MRARPEPGGWRSSCGGSVGKNSAATSSALAAIGRLETLADARELMTPFTVAHLECSEWCSPVNAA